MRGHYSEKWKVITVADQPVLIHVTDDLSEQELVYFFDVAVSQENYEYCEALEVEANTRNFTLKQLKK